MTNTVTLVNNSGQSGWAAYDPSGTAINISTSTTSGLQECFDYCTTNGYNLEVDGRATSSTQDFGLLNCTTGISIAPMRMMDVKMRGVHIIFSSSVTGDGLTFDSIQNSNIDIVGEITYQGTGSAVVFNPRTSIPVDTTTEINGSKISILGIVATGNAPFALVKFNPASGSIIGDHFYFAELNGSGNVSQSPMANFGIVAMNVSASTVMANNTINVGELHGVTSTGVQVGVNTSYQGNYSTNHWLINEITVGTSNPSGFNTFGSYDEVYIGSIGGSGSGNSIYLQPGSAHNNVRVGSAGNVGGVVNQGIGNAVTFN